VTGLRQRRWPRADPHRGRARRHRAASRRRPRLDRASRQRSPLLAGTSRPSGSKGWTEGLGAWRLAPHPRGAGVAGAMRRGALGALGSRSPPACPPRPRREGDSDKPSRGHRRERARRQVQAPAPTPRGRAQSPAAKRPTAGCPPPAAEEGAAAVGRGARPRHRLSSRPVARVTCLACSFRKASSCSTCQRERQKSTRCLLSGAPVPLHARAARPGPPAERGDEDSGVPPSLLGSRPPRVSPDGAPT